MEVARALLWNILRKVLTVSMFECMLLLFRAIFWTNYTCSIFLARVCHPGFFFLILFSNVKDATRSSYPGSLPNHICFFLATLFFTMLGYDFFLTSELCLWKPNPI